MPRVIRRMKSISLKVFLFIVFGVLLPIFCMNFYVKTTYENYIQEEISTKIIQGIAKGEEGIYSIFGNMAGMSSLICTNPSVLEALENPELSFFERTTLFDSCVKQTIINNMFDSTEMYVAMFDREKRIYTNWPVNYYNYSFLLEKDWVKESIKKKGHLVWSMFTPPYVLQDSNSETSYISLARSILSEKDGTYLGTLLISIRQDQFVNVLRQYSYTPEDSTFLCMDDGNIVLSSSSTNFVPREVQVVFKQLRTSNQNSTIYKLEDNLSLVTRYTLSGKWMLNGSRLHVLHFTDYESVQMQMNDLARKINWIMAFSMLVLTIIILFISSAIGKPVRILAKQMRHYDLDTDLPNFDVARQDEVGDLHRSFYKMSNKIRDLFLQLNKEYEIKEMYRFESLRAQLNPHFLFNTLNSIRWMALIRKADNIVESIDALASMLQYSMSRGDELVTLREELSNIQSYIYIQNMRYGEKLDVEIDFDESVKDLLVIKFILQPIVENAVLHGFKEKQRLEKNIIKVYGDVLDGCLQIFVEDNGCGISNRTIENFNQQKLTDYQNNKKLTGLGLKNIDQRIRIEYGEKYGLQIQSHPNTGSIVRYLLPMIVKEGNVSCEKSDDCRR